MKYLVNYDSSKFATIHKAFYERNSKINANQGVKSIQISFL